MYVIKPKLILRGNKEKVTNLSTRTKKGVKSYFQCKFSYFIELTEIFFSSINKGQLISFYFTCFFIYICSQMVNTHY